MQRHAFGVLMASLERMSEWAHCFAPDRPTSADMKAHERTQLLQTLKQRFETNMPRHEGIEWATVLTRIEQSHNALNALLAMESTGGEPDVIGQHESGQLVFCDCAKESPTGRRSLCYDRKALDSRKENKPQGSVVETAANMGIEILSEQQYRDLQKLGEFDTRTSSWIKTPQEVRTLGGALFCDRRYNKVFVYHNGANSYYAARGFRGSLLV